MEFIALERLVEPPPAVPEAILAPEDCNEIRPAGRPPSAPLPVEALDILGLPRLVSDPKWRVCDKEVALDDLRVIGHRPRPLALELRSSLLFSFHLKPTTLGDPPLADLGRRLEDA